MDGTVGTYSGYDHLHRTLKQDKILPQRGEVLPLAEEVLSTYSCREGSPSSLRRYPLLEQPFSCRKSLIQEYGWYELDLVDLQNKNRAQS